MTCYWQRLPGTSPGLCLNPDLQLGWCFDTFFCLPVDGMCGIFAYDDFLGIDELPSFSKEIPSKI